MSNSPQPKSWRDVLPIHPAADLFPPILEAELKELAGDIEAHGLQTPVVVWNPSEDPEDEDRYLLLDGRSRLDALALLGLLHVDQHGEIHLNKSWNGATWLAYETSFALLARHRDGGDPYALALSLNLHRRHLTTEQKRKLIAMTGRSRSRQRLARLPSARSEKSQRPPATCPSWTRERTPRVGSNRAQNPKSRQKRPRR